MRVLSLALFAACASLVQADRVDTYLAAPGWRIQSSENLWAGSRHTSYPLTNLIDGDPKTSWVFSGIAYPVMTEAEHGQGVVKDVYVGIRFDLPTEVDEIRLMNGYNKDKSTFFKNSRITEIEVYDGTPWEGVQPIRRVTLSDTMGMKSIWVPKRKYNQLFVRASKITKGQDDDICISEFMVRAGGGDVLKKSKTYLEGSGSDCG